MYVHLIYHVYLYNISCSKYYLSCTSYVVEIFHDTTARAMLAHLAFDAQQPLLESILRGGCLSDVHLRYVRIWRIFSQKVANKNKYHLRSGYYIYIYTAAVGLSMGLPSLYLLSYAP